MSGTLYSKSEFCRRAGITPETLRHYLDLGLVAPARVQANGYRLYAPQSLLDVWSCRLGLALGSPLKQLPSLWDESACEGFLRFLDRRQTELEAQLQDLQRQCRMVEEIRRYVAAEREGAERVTEEPAFAGWNVFCDGSARSARQTAAFVAALPFTYVQIDYPLPGPSQPLGEPKVGLGVFDDRWDKLGLPDTAGLQRMRAGSALCCTLFTAEPLALTREALAPLLEELARRGLTAHSPLMCTPYHHETGPDGKTRYLLKCRILVRPATDAPA